MPEEKYFDEGMYKEIGFILKQMREEHSYTLREAEKKTGIPSSTLHRYETGETRPTIEKVKQILAGYREDENTFRERLYDCKLADQYVAVTFENVVENVKELNEDQLTRLYYYIGGLLRK